MSQLPPPPGPTQPAPPHAPSNARPDPSVDMRGALTALRREREWRDRMTALPSVRLAVRASRDTRRARRLALRVVRRAVKTLPEDRVAVVRQRLDDALDRPDPEPLADPRPPAARRRLAGVPSVDGDQAVDVVFLLLVADPTDDDLDALLTAVRRVQRDQGDIGIVVVTDSEAFHLFRRHGMLFEHLPPRARWEGREDDRRRGGWDRMLGRRLALLTDAWQPDAVLVMDPRPSGRDLALANLAATMREHVPTT